MMDVANMQSMQAHIIRDMCDEQTLCEPSGQTNQPKKIHTTAGVESKKCQDSRLHAFIKFYRLFTAGNN